MYEIFASAMNDHVYDLAIKAQTASAIGTGVNVDSVREQNAALNRTLDSLQGVQRETASSLKEFLRYNDVFQRQLFFGRSIETVRNDINYIYAVVQKHNAITGSKKAAEESKEKQGDLDAEIRKLQKEADELDRKSASENPSKDGKK